MAFALHLLGRHDTAQQRVRDEVRRVWAIAHLADTDIDRLEYTTQVVSEALRLHPSGHTIVRHAHPSARLCGHDVSPGRIVAVSVWGIHHNPDVWADPERFDPDRVDKRRGEDESDAQARRYSHPPYGGGPRGCIGQHLAIAELVVGVASVVRAYQLESMEDVAELDVRHPPAARRAVVPGSNPRDEAMLGDTASPSVRSRSDSWRPFTDARDRSAARMLRISTSGGAAESAGHALADRFRSAARRSSRGLAN